MREFAHLFTLERMAKLLGVTRQGFYAHLRRKGPKDRSTLEREILEVYRESGRRYGEPKIRKELAKRGVFCSKTTVEAIMKKAGIQGVSRKRKRPRTTDSNHDEPIAPNLLQRVFAAVRRNLVWVSDITYIRTVRGWLYLCLVVDLHSRRVVGWRLADHMRAELVTETFRDAWAARRPGQGLVFHSDRGPQYASAAFRQVLSDCRARQSMSRKGDCWDNAVAESVIGLIKAELSTLEFENEEEARRALFEYIEVFYNRKRLHSYLGYQTPAEFEGENAA